MKLNKLFILAGIALASAFTSCSDDSDYAAGPQPAGTQLNGVTFGNFNNIAIELDPADPTTYEISISRTDASQTITVPLKVLKNTDNVYAVPESVIFQEGQTEAFIQVSFNNASVGTPYKLEVKIDDAFVNPYASNSTCLFEVTRVKWNSIGTGMWYDGFWYEEFGCCWDVEVFQRDDSPNIYRIASPYTNEELEQYGGGGGTYTPWHVFSVDEDDEDRVYYDTFYFNTLYMPGAEIVGYPIESEEDKAYRMNDGSINYISIDPEWYIPALGGGFGSGYPCFLIMPGKPGPDGLFDGPEGDGDEEEEGEEEGEE